MYISLSEELYYFYYLVFYLFFYVFNYLNTYINFTLAKRSHCNSILDEKFIISVYKIKEFSVNELIDWKRHNSQNEGTQCNLDLINIILKGLASKGALRPSSILTFNCCSF